jgi:ComF family protein
MTEFGREITTPARTAATVGVQVEQAGTPTLFSMILNTVYPMRCAGCQRLRGGWCRECARNLDAVPTEFTLRSIADLDLVMSTGAYEGLLRDAVRALKYHGVRPLGAVLGARIAAGIQLMGWSVDAIVPTPLPQGRQRTRGYNQAALIGAAVADILNCPLLPNALTRVRETRTQVGLTAIERLQNLRGAFASRESFAGQRVLVIDDVVTTGATLAGCATALRLQGASAVFGAAVAGSVLP